MSHKTYPADPILLNKPELNITFEPPTIDISLPLIRSDWTVWLKATSVVEQAVSIVILAPRKSKKWEMRHAVNKESVLVAKYPGMLSSSRIIFAR